MPNLTADALFDLVAVTLPQLNRMKWTELTTDLTSFTALSQLINKNKVIFDSGPSIQWQLTTSLTGNSRNTGLYASDNLNVSNVTAQAEAPWRYTTTGYAFDVNEMAMNASPSRILDLMKLRRIDAMTDLAVLMERNFWSAPTSSTDKESPWGLPYWLVKNSATGFNGGAPSGFTDVAGVSPTTVPRWRNYTAQYTAINKTDLIRKWREAHVKTAFKPPVEGISALKTGNKNALYTNYAVLGPIEEILEGQNQNLGNDVASKDGQVTFRRTPLTYVPYLDADTQNPIYGVNWGVFKPVFLKGRYMVETPALRASGKHNVTEVHIDMTYNFVCYNRREQYVLATA